MATKHAVLRTRWAAAGAALAVTFGAVGLGGLNVASAGLSDGDRPVFVPIDPCRLVDTRASIAVGPKVSPLGPGETYTVTAHGENGECTGASKIPTDAVSLALNVTAVAPTANTFLTLWGGGANPGTSNLNPRAGGAPTPNSVNTPLSDSGTFNIFNNSGNVNVIVDVNGYYADHDHDDRYYTEEEADARFAPAGVGADVTLINIYSWDIDDTTQWRLDQVLDHDPSVSQECVSAPIALPVGRTVAGLTVSYLATADADVRVTIVRTLNRVGPFVSELEILGVPIPEITRTLPGTLPTTIGSATFDATAPEIVDPRASYVAFICTADDVTFVGTTVNTPLL